MNEDRPIMKATEL